MSTPRGGMRRRVLDREAARDDARAKARALRSRALALAGALRAGSEASPVRGSGVEPADVRAYGWGDDARRIDWSVTARTGVPHLRETEPDRDLPVLVAVSRLVPRWTDTWSLSALVAGALGIVQLGSGHEVGLIEIGEDGPSLVPPGSGPRHAERLLDRALGEHARSTGSLPVHLPAPAGGVLAAGLRLAREALGERGLVIVVSDFREEPPDRWSPDAFALVRRHRLLPVWVESPSAADLRGLGMVTLRRGTGRTALDTDRPTVRDALLAEEATARARLDGLFARLGTSPIRLRGGEDPVPALAAGLATFGRVAA